MTQSKEIFHKDMTKIFTVSYELDVNPLVQNDPMIVSCGCKHSFI